MIKPQELRIGNYVYGVSDRVEKVIELHAGILITNHYKSELLSSPFEHKYEEIKPIPLTEEWLIKLGFKKNIENDFIVVLPNGDASELSIEKAFEHKYYNILFTRGIVKGVPGKDYDYVYGGEIKYLHQLQNLYFALTGEELCFHTTTG